METRATMMRASASPGRRMNVLATAANVVKMLAAAFRKKAVPSNSGSRSGKKTTSRTRIWSSPRFDRILKMAYKASA